MENNHWSKRVFAKDLEDYLRVSPRSAKRRFTQIKSFHSIVYEGIVRWKHVYEWEEALNKGLVKGDKV